MCYKTEIRQIFYSICALLLLSGAAYGASVLEIEPNDDIDHATLINAGDVANGVVGYDNKDFFKLTLPQSGIVTAKLSGYSDCQFEVTVVDFGYGWGIGSLVSENGKPSTISFSAPKNKPGYLRVGIRTVSGVSGGEGGKYWRIIQCNKDGPYYTTPGPAGEASMTITTYEGKPVYPPLTYQLDVSLAALPDQYEPNYEEGTPKEDMLARGIIKTIPIGQEITAYLFNEHPAVLKGTPGYESSWSYGGENDVDVYHVSLSQPGTVNVRLGNFPANANSRIIITRPDGNSYESATGATDFSVEATKPGNVFIEISKGRETGNLVYSTTPYNLRVTTGATTPTAAPTVTPTVTSTVTPTVTATVTATATPAKTSGGELVKNGDFSEGLNGWTIQEWYKPSDGKGEVTEVSDGIRFRSTSGNTHIGIMQTINSDVSGCSALNLRAVIKADEQSLAGTGWNGRESPISVFARYTDVNGVLHGNLGEDPKEQNRMLWAGLYYIDPTGKNIADFGIRTQKGEWYTYETDLMKLSPKPRTIDIIGAEGAGWATRDGVVKSISLKCVAVTSTVSRTPAPYTPAKVTYTPVISSTETTDSGARDFRVAISPTSMTVNPGDTLRLTLTVMPSGGFNEPVEISVKIKALGQERDLGQVTTIYPPYQPYVFENQVPGEIPKGTTIYGYVTGRGAGLERNADTVTVKVPGFGVLAMFVALIAVFLIRRKKEKE
ncbi:MAG: hypothetical protein WA144_00345 [Candidatus Methanoperedens sp.]